MESQVEKRAIGDVFEKTECYTANVSELAGEMGDEFVSQAGDFVQFDFATYIKLINVLWAKVKETAFECEGKTIEVRLPDSIVGQILKATIAVIGIKL